MLAVTLFLLTVIVLVLLLSLVLKVALELALVVFMVVEWLLVCLLGFESELLPNWPTDVETIIEGVTHHTYGVKVLVGVDRMSEVWG